MEHLYNHYYAATPFEADDEQDVDNDIATDLIYNELYGRNFTQGFALADNEDQLIMSDIGAEKEASLLNSFSVPNRKSVSLRLGSLASPAKSVSAVKTLIARTDSPPVPDTIKEKFMNRMMEIFMMMFHIMPFMPRYFDAPAPYPTSECDAEWCDTHHLKIPIAENDSQDTIITWSPENT